MVQGEARMTRPDAATEALAEVGVAQLILPGEPDFRFGQRFDDDNQCLRLTITALVRYVIRKARKSG